MRPPKWTMSTVLAYTRYFPLHRGKGILRKLLLDPSFARRGGIASCPLGTELKVEAGLTNPLPQIQLNLDDQPQYLMYLYGLWEPDVARLWLLIVQPEMVI